MIYELYVTMFTKIINFYYQTLKFEYYSEYITHIIGHIQSKFFLQNQIKLYNLYYIIN